MGLFPHLMTQYFSLQHHHVDVTLTNDNSQTFTFISVSYPYLTTSLDQNCFNCTLHCASLIRPWLVLCEGSTGFIFPESLCLLRGKSFKNLQKVVWLLPTWITLDWDEIYRKINIYLYWEFLFQLSAFCSCFTWNDETDNKPQPQLVTQMELELCYDFVNKVNKWQHCRVYWYSFPIISSCNQRRYNRHN